MSNFTVAEIAVTVHRNTAYSEGYRLVNTDGTPFDSSAGTLTGQIRRTPAPESEPLGTFSITRPIPANGYYGQALSAHDAGLLPVSLAAPLYGEIDLVPDADPRNPIILVKMAITVVDAGNAVVEQSAAPTVPLEIVNLVVGGASAETTRALLGLSKRQIAYQVLMG